MKKILACMVLIGLTTLNANLFGMNEKQEIAKNEKTQISKMDYAKITAAAIGIAFFGTNTITSGLLSRDLNAIRESNKVLLPLQIILIPIAIIYKKLEIQDTNQHVMNLFKAISAGSALIASGLGIYLYKKLSELRKKQSDQNKISDKV